MSLDIMHFNCILKVSIFYLRWISCGFYKMIIKKEKAYGFETKTVYELVNLNSKKSDFVAKSLVFYFI